MKTKLLPSLAKLSGCVGLALCLNLSLHAAPTPYLVDSDTLHLYHFDEVQNTNTTLPELIVSNIVRETFWNLYVQNGAKLVPSSCSPSLINALDTEFTIPGTTEFQQGAFGQEDLHYYPDDFAGSSGEFTYEALVSLGFDPKTPDVTRPNMQIMSLENEGDTDVRVFQFRLGSNSTNEQFSLEFENIGSAAPGSNAPVTTLLINDFNDTLGTFDDTVILDDNGGTANTYAWDNSDGMLKITTTTYDGIEQYALTTNLTLPIGTQLVCDYDNAYVDSQDIGLYVGDGTPAGIPSARSNYVTVYIRNDGNVYTRGFDGPNEFGLVGGGVHPDLEYLFIARTDTNVFETGYYEAGNRIVMATRSNSFTGIGTSVGIYADVRAVGTRGSVDNLRFATNFLAVPPAAPELFTALLPTNGPNAAYKGEWYHVAVTYNGAENTANNLRFYWTSISNSPASANLLGTFQMTNDLGSAATVLPIEADFTVGNEGRDTPGESFDGIIDEVRISSVARAANGFSLDGTPYTADGSTLLLYHFDEAIPPDFPTNLVNDAYDEVTVNGIDCDVRSGATFGETSYTGFGTAMLVSTTTSSNNFPLNDAAGAYGNVFNLPFDPNFGSAETGFTFEALVRPEFDPTSTNQFMQIICGEGDGGVEERGWQFRFEERLDPVNPLRLEFIKIAGGEAHLFATVPTAGPHAILQSSWYHVAVTYNGDTNDSSNVLFYWTALDSGDTDANLIWTTNITADVQGTAIDFSIGNEDRSTGGNTDAFIGAIDEVRISKVARAADEFLLVEQVPQPEITAISADLNAGEVTLTWTSSASKTYTIGRADTLGGAYSPVATGIQGGSPATTQTVSMGGSTGFYRVEVE